MRNDQPCTSSKTIYAHFIGWALFIIYELATVYYLTGQLNPAAFYMAYYTVNIALFYGHLRLLSFSFPTGRHRRLFRGALGWLLLLAGYLVVKYLLNRWLSQTPPLLNGHFNPLWRYAVLSLYRAATFLIMATIYWAADHLAEYRQRELRSLKEQAELAVELANARNAYLQQRLNPHLLFNALSFIYSQVQRCSAEGSRAVELLSGLLRYTLEAPGDDGKAELADEVAQLARLVEINRYRFGAELQLDLALEPGPAGLRIIPLVLLTLTENIFKHGNLRDPAHRAALRVSAGSDGLLTYTSTNRKKQQPEAARTGGLGLRDSRLRLGQAYPGRYQLDVRDLPDRFELYLTIQL